MLKFHLQVSSMELIHKFQHKSDALKTKEKVKIMRENIVDYNVMQPMTGRIMNSFAVV